MPNISTCNSPTCAVTVDGQVQTCPKCGGPMRHLTESKARAWLLVFCGVFLILMMGGITLVTAPMMLQPGSEFGDSSWEGTREQGQIALALFGVVILFGFASLGNGLYMLKTGKQHRGFIVATLVLVALLALVIFGFAQAFSGTD
jgi:hypothetical protein